MTSRSPVPDSSSMSSFDIFVSSAGNWVAVAEVEIEPSNINTANEMEAPRMSLGLGGLSSRLSVFDY